MTILELKNHLTNLIGHVTFEYNGYSCGIDPLSLNKFDMWYGNDAVTVNSIEKVMNEPLFNGKSLKDIWDDITNLDF
jgi:hypothetical protein